MENTKFISEDELKNQREYIDKIKKLKAGKKAMVVTYGCAQNETDGDKLYGILFQMGYVKAESEHEADVLIFNTCSVRENAEIKVYSKLGAHKAKKYSDKSFILGVCGCLMQQEHASQKIKKSYPFVDLVFGTHSLYRFPEILYRAITKQKKRYFVDDIDGQIVEGLPINREKSYKATIPIAFGCNNFCSYCVVPVTRGRERSRKSSDIFNEISALSKTGLKEVMLVGQNVNSYGNDRKDEMDFSDLLTAVSEIKGIKRIRFVTSHPKDLTDKLIDTIANNPKICKTLHLPFQAGNNRILKEMNRKYTREEYLVLIDKVKKAIPSVSLTSDVIVGFPTETDAEFMETVSLIKKVRFDNLYTFIYSKREQTKAALIIDNKTYEEKLENFNILLMEQTKICKEVNDTYLNHTYEIMDEGISKNNVDMRSGRTDTNKVVNYKPKSVIKEGDFVTVRVTESYSWSLNGVEV